MESVPGRRVFVPGNTVVKFEGLQLRTAEQLVDYFENSLKPSLEAMKNDTNEGVDPGEGVIADINADRPLGRVNSKAFGLAKDKFEEITDAWHGASIGGQDLDE